MSGRKRERERESAQASVIVGMGGGENTQMGCKERPSLHMCVCAWKRVRQKRQSERQSRLVIDRGRENGSTTRRSRILVIEPRAQLNQCNIAPSLSLFVCRISTPSLTHSLSLSLSFSYTDLFSRSLHEAMRIPCVRYGISLLSLYRSFPQPASLLF
jgi:hypothetical protein